MRQKDYLESLKENKILKEQKIKQPIEKVEDCEESESLQEFGFGPRGSSIDKIDARQGLMGSVGGFNFARKEKVARIKQKAKEKALPLMKKKWAAQAKKQGSST